MENHTSEWMRTGGTLILGHLHMALFFSMEPGDFGGKEFGVTNFVPCYSGTSNQNDLGGPPILGNPHVLTISNTISPLSVVKQGP